MSACPGGTWSPRPTEDGSWTLWNEELGEACHSLAGAWQQATERYAGACGLAERAQAGMAELRSLDIGLLDIGTGLGLNLAAALRALGEGSARLRALTLERDPEVLTRGLELYERAELRAGAWERWHAPVRAALRASLERPGRPVALASGTLELRLGDARDTLEEATEPALFDAVFLDPFSPRRAPELWQEPFLASVARRMASGAWLSTYSASFAVRLALARAGLRVGRGARVGAKGEGTLASPDREPPVLAPRLARRLARRTVVQAVPEGPFLPFRLRDRARGFD
jgi:tRNA U34 5-methylaminomethyl-2-thiouridine-forming methyltransferase MnmC